MPLGKLSRAFTCPRGLSIALGNWASLYFKPLYAKNNIYLPPWQRRLCFWYRWFVCLSVDNITQNIVVAYQIVVQVMIQTFFFFFFFFFFWGGGGGGGGGGSLSPPRLNIFTVGNMGVMICLGQGGLHSLSASSSRMFLVFF